MLMEGSTRFFTPLPMSVSSGDHDDDVWCSSGLQHEHNDTSSMFASFNGFSECNNNTDSHPLAIPRDPDRTIRTNQQLYWPRKGRPKTKELFLVRDRSELEEVEKGWMYPEKDDTDNEEPLNCLHLGGIFNAGPEDIELRSYDYEHVLGTIEEVALQQMQITNGHVSAVVAPQNSGDDQTKIERRRDNWFRFIPAYSLHNYTPEVRLLRYGTIPSAMYWPSDHWMELILGPDGPNVCDVCDRSLCQEWLARDGTKRNDLCFNQRPIVPSMYHNLVPSFVKTCPCFTVRLCVFQNENGTSCWEKAKEAELKMSKCFTELAGCTPDEGRCPAADLTRPRSQSELVAPILQKPFAMNEERTPAQYSDNPGIGCDPLETYTGSGNHYRSCTGYKDGCLRCKRNLLASALRKHNRKLCLSSVGALPADLEKYIIPVQENDTPLTTNPLTLSVHERAVHKWFAGKYGNEWPHKLVECCRAVYLHCFGISGSPKRSHIWLGHKCDLCLYCDCSQLSVEAQIQMTSGADLSEAQSNTVQ